MAEAPVLEVGVKYCGGCNPRYDRTALCARLKASCTFARFAPAVPGQPCDVLLALCGCTAQCADLTGLRGRYRQWTVSGPGGEPGAAAFLCAAAQQKKERPYGLENHI